MTTKFFTVDAQDPDLGGQLLPGVKLRVSKRTFAQIAAERFQALQAEGVAFRSTQTQGVDALQGRALLEAAARAKLA